MDNEFDIEMEDAPEVTSHTIWAEKYRPKTLDELVGDSTFKAKIKDWIDKKDIPHLLLHSNSPGTGKTSIGKLLIKYIPCDSEFVNASDNNGVDFIRDRVQNFCYATGVYPIKIMFLDEADRLSQDAMCVLRNMMETYSGHVRFILTCNYKERIIPAIHSRCQSFEVSPVSKPDAMKLIVNILTKENIKFELKDVAFIISSYFPDLRKIINFTQQSIQNGELVLKKANAIDQDYKNKLVDMLKNHSKAGLFNELRQLVADAAFSNYEEVYKYLFEKVNDYAGTKAPEVILILAEAVYQSAMVFEREITFVATLHRILTTLNK